MAVTEEMLIGYVDGELTPDVRAEVEAAVAADAGLAARLDEHRALRARLASAFAGVLDEPTPSSLVEMIARGGPAPVEPVRRGQVLDLAQARERIRPPQTLAKARPNRAWIGWAAAAACLIIAVAVLQPRVTTPAGPMIAAADDRLVAQGALAGALDRQLVSGTAGAAPTVKVGLSFRSNDGLYCRTFQIERAAGMAGVACREPDRWVVRAAVAAPETQAGGYRTAASSIPQAVLDSVDGMIAGQPMDAAAERAARDHGWRP